MVGTSVVGGLTTVIYNGAEVIYAQSYAVDDTFRYTRVKRLGHPGIKEDILSHVEVTGTLHSLVVAGDSEGGPWSFTKEAIINALAAMSSTDPSSIYLKIEGRGNVKVEDDMIGQVRISQVSKRVDIAGNPYIAAVGFIGIREEFAQ